MKRFLFALGTIGLLTLPGTQQLAASTTAPPRPTLPADEQLFTGLVGQVGAAIEKNDMKALSQLMTPEYVHYTPDNNMGNRAEELAFVGQWVGTTVKSVSPVKVIRRGDMAVTVATTTFSGEFKSKPFKNTVNMMIAWELRGGHWQMAVVHSKAVPA